MKVLLLLFITFNSLANEVDLNSCGTNEKARELAKLILTSENQQRPVLICNNKLSLAAFDKAKAMAKVDKIQHIIDYVSPNELLSSNGIILPFNYLVIGNQVESIIGGTKSALETFNTFMTSKDHKAHLLGEIDFVKQQNQIGVGFYKDKTSDYRYFWVVHITALRKEGDLFLKPEKKPYQFILNKPKKYKKYRKKR